MHAHEREGGRESMLARASMPVHVHACVRIFADACKFSLAYTFQAPVHGGKCRRRWRGGGRASAAVAQDKDKSANKGAKLEKLDLQPPKVTDFGRLRWGGVCV